jgi:hypothetical protein
VQGDALLSGALSVANITATGTATTSSLVIPSITGSFLKTDGNGKVVAAVSGIDYATFGYPFPSNATSTNLSFSNGLTVSGGNLTIGSLSGILHASSGVVSASSVNLATEVTGTLPFGNGGTGATGFTTGSVIYSSGSALTEDPTRLYYSSLNHFLGIGNNSPQNRLSVTGGLSVGSSGYNVTAPTNGAIIEGNVGIGTTSPGSLLSIGNTNGINFSTATSTFSTTGGINLTSGCFAVNGTCITGGGGGGSGTVNSGTTGQFPYYAANGTTLTATSTLFLTTSGNIGIGTSSPVNTFEVASNSAGIAKFSRITDADAKIAFNAAGLNKYFIGYSQTNSGNFEIDDNNASPLLSVTSTGNVGIGTSSPYAKLSVVGEAVARNFTATSTTATSTFNGGLNVGSGALTYDYSSNLTSIANLAIGALTFDTDSGAISWADMPVTSSPSAGTIESYSAQIDGNSLLTVYGEADGAGGIQNGRVGIGTTSPNSVLTIGGGGSDAYIKTGTAGYLGSTIIGTAAGGGFGGVLTLTDNSGNTTGVIRSYASSGVQAYFTAGNVGIGTTTPGSLLSVGNTNGINFSTATSTFSTTGGINLTSGCFAVNGTCITGGGGGGSGTVNSGTTGQFPYYAANGTTLTATSTLFLATTGYVGIGSTSPNANLTITQTGTYGEWIGTDSNTTRFVLNRTGSYSGTDILSSIIGSYNGDSLTSINTTRDGANDAGVLNFGTQPAGGTVLERMRITSTGNVGIGTTSPWALLSINPDGIGTAAAFTIGSSTQSLFSVANNGLTTIGSANGTGDANFQFGGDTNAWSIGYYSTDKSFRIASSTNLSSNVAVSITKGGALVPGADNAQTLGSASLHWDCVYYDATSQGTCASDASLKENINDFVIGEHPLAELTSLRPRTFTYKDNPTGALNYGFIAQEVQAVAPDLVTTSPDTGLLAVHYAYLPYLTIEALKELNLDVLAIASSSASTTPDAKRFADGFFSNLFTRLVAWMGDTANGIQDLVANRVRTKQLCVSDGSSETCVSKAQLDALLSGVHASTGSTPSGGGSPSTGTSTPPDTGAATSTDPGIGDTTATSTDDGTGGDTSGTPDTGVTNDSSSDSSGTASDPSSEGAGATESTPPATTEPAPPADPAPAPSGGGTDTAQGG